MPERQGEERRTESPRREAKAAGVRRPRNNPLPILRRAGNRVHRRTIAASREIEDPTMYIRVKRNKTTYFIQCDPTETTLDIKQKLHSLVDQPPCNQRLILLATNDVLDDSKTLANQKVENDAIVALTLRKDDSEFEDVFIARPEDFMSSS